MPRRAVIAWSGPNMASDRKDLFVADVESSEGWCRQQPWPRGPELSAIWQSNAAGSLSTIGSGAQGGDFQAGHGCSYLEGSWDGSSATPQSQTPLQVMPQQRKCACNVPGVSVLGLLDVIRFFRSTPFLTALKGQADKSLFLPLGPISLLS